MRAWRPASGLGRTTWARRYGGTSKGGIDYWLFSKDNKFSITAHCRCTVAPLLSLGWAESAARWPCACRPSVWPSSATIPSSARRYSRHTAGGDRVLTLLIDSATVHKFPSGRRCNQHRIPATGADLAPCWLYHRSRATDSRHGEPDRRWGYGRIRYLVETENRLEIVGQIGLNWRIEE